MFDFEFLKRSAAGNAASGSAAAPGSAPDGLLQGTQGDAANGYLGCALLLDAQMRVQGYRMSWRVPGGQVDPVESTRAMLSCLARHLNPEEEGWRLGNRPVHVDIDADALFLPELQELPPENVVLRMSLDEVLDPDIRTMVAFMREQGFGLLLSGGDKLPSAIAADPELLMLATHLDVDDGDEALIDALRASAPAGQLLRPLVATRMLGWEHFDRCTAMQVEVFVDEHHPGPQVKVESDELHPDAMQLVQLMQMLQRNEKIAVIETALKRDAALTYRLLRHINSPAIGAGVEITSMRHAVAMLGYSPLFRWLSVLLATTSGVSSPFMMKRAIMRGRFVELMGRGMLAAGEADNLFVVGMFSLMDQLLGMPMREVLAHVQLTDAVQQAILSRQGVYAPFLELVEASVADEGQLAKRAEALFASADQVNAAHLQALAWAREISQAGNA
ncbi:HDOD domain-containing protein [Variovorax dokdonensis]|uniref:HDOD domain-containing protein n=1 Tax=Variovorax dokdonensis TaxID=344883 RepID=A0ABT7N525_9BURK|nr:HDOD domain-containing protein [Variovorax dokdonensis]MDM0042980.1 HDOD domain-containing protein [Variovorax dokdonensis]